MNVIGEDGAYLGYIPFRAESCSEVYCKEDDRWYDVHLRKHYIEKSRTNPDTNYNSEITTLFNYTDSTSVWFITNYECDSFNWDYFGTKIFSIKALYDVHTPEEMELYLENCNGVYDILDGWVGDIIIGVRFIHGITLIGLSSWKHNSNTDDSEAIVHLKDGVTMEKSYTSVAVRYFTESVIVKMTKLLFADCMLGTWTIIPYDSKSIKEMNTADRDQGLIIVQDRKECEIEEKEFNELADGEFECRYI